jgi:hypothetical protein
MYAVRRGLAAVGAVNCADFFTWPPNIFNPQCYGITAAKLFGTPEEKAAAYAATSPEVVYAPVQAPPAVSAPPVDRWVSPPASGEDAAGAIDDILARQQRAAQSQNKATMDASAASIQRLEDDAKDGAGFDWKILALVGVSGLALFSMVSGRGRN